MNYQEVFESMIIEAIRKGISYKLFNQKYEAYKFCDAFRKHLDKPMYELFEIGVKQSSYRHIYAVYLSKDRKNAKKLLPFEFQPFTNKSGKNEYWVIRNLTKQEYLHISGLPESMKDSHDWIKQKCEEVLDCEVEIEIYESENAGWVAKLRRKENAIQSKRDISDQDE